MDFQQFVAAFAGKRLIRDMNSPGGLLLVPRHTVLDRKHLRLLFDHDVELGFRDIETPAADSSLQAEAAAHVRPPSPDGGSLASLQAKCTEMLDGTTIKMQEYFDEIRFTKKVPIEDIRSDIMPHIQEASEHPHLFGLLSNLQAKDDYTYRHNIGVGVLATLLGKWLGLRSKELSELSTAATLHDVGKMLIPLEVLNKPGKLTPEEYELIKKHTLFGYEMLSQTKGAAPIEATVALQHHERQDGSGYPYGIKAADINLYSKIVAVADVYHAMSSRRAYHEPAPFYAILNRMMNNGFGEFDPKIVRVFIDKIMQMAVGNDVLLSDDRRGTIVLVHPGDPLRPLVQVGNEFIDLRSELSLHITQVIG